MFTRKKEDEIGTAPKRRRKKLLAGFVLCMHLLGAITSVRAVMSTRTSQGAIAWAIGLNTFPYVAVPCYWVLGQSKFDGYDLLRRSEHLNESETAIRARQILEDENLILNAETAQQESHERILKSLSRLPITSGNTAKLLVDGEETFDAIFDGIAQAEDYILFQFYILRDDELGQRFKQAFVDKAAAGVRIFMLYDELGSKNLSPEYIADLRNAGVEIYPFNTTQGKGNRFRVNFRNHRKIVVVDGRVAYVGGHNVGDEYLGKDPKLSPWRDTHVELRGPVVQCVQVTFLEDWNWATKQMPTLNWDPERGSNRRGVKFRKADLPKKVE
jgi:cardiolipin synthase